MSLPIVSITAKGHNDEPSASARDLIVKLNGETVPGLLSFTLTGDANGTGVDRYANLTLRLLVKIGEVEFPARVTPELYAMMRASEGEAMRPVRLHDEDAAA